MHHIESHVVKELCLAHLLAYTIYEIDEISMIANFVDTIVAP